MENSVLADVEVIRIHIKNIIEGRRLEDLPSYPHVILIGFFRRIYFDEELSAVIEILQDKERSDYYEKK